MTAASISTMIDLKVDITRFCSMQSVFSAMDSLQIFHKNDYYNHVYFRKLRQRDIRLCLQLPRYSDSSEVCDMSWYRGC